MTAQYRSHIGSLTVSSRYRYIVYGSVRGLVSEQSTLPGARQGGYSEAYVYLAREARWDQWGGRTRHGFTIVELLTVVTIIGLLIAILLPALGLARARAVDTMTRAWIGSLGSACEMYASDAANSWYYPGQVSPQDFAGGSGSHLLARALFTEATPPRNPSGSPPPVPAFPVPQYIQFAAGCLATADGIEDCILDRNPPSKAVLYYLPHSVGEGGPIMWHPSDNRIHWAPETAAWQTLITPYYASEPVNTRTPSAHFLLVAAGMDRLYGTQDDIRYPTRDAR